MNHQLLGIHHACPGPHELAYALGFLALGILLIVGGSIALASSGTLFV